MKILSVSYGELYKDVPHAGGQTYAYYMSKIANDPDLNLKVICMSESKEKSNVNFKDFNATGTVLYRKGSIKNLIKRLFWDIYGLIFNKDYVESYFKFHEFKKAIKKLKKEKYIPDLIILEWTQCAVLAKVCKKIYPNVKVIASEHDVRFLGVERQVKRQSNIFSKKIWTAKAKNAKRRELKALHKCDYILTHNIKDTKLLLKNGITEEKISNIVPYYKVLSNKKRSLPFNNDAIFWGAMSRKENYEAAEWFINNVMNEKCNYRFIIIGNKPPENLKKMENSNIIVTGFVKDPEIYFENSICMVVPLLSGAGIKVKVLEAMASGIPVLTNDIGIEGIYAQNELSYLHCETPQEYTNAIKKLINDPKFALSISENAIKHIKSNFNLQESGINYINLIKKMIGGI